MAGLFPDDNGCVSGLVLCNANAGELARLDYYMAIRGQVRRSVTVKTGNGNAISASGYIMQPDDSAQMSAWDQDGWIASHGAAETRAVAEIMAHRDSHSPAQLAQKLPGIRIRASAWVAAQARPADPTRDISRDVVVHAHHRPYVNFFAAEELDLQHRRYDGSLSEVMNRGGQLLGHAVSVLPYDPRRDQVLIVEQFRTPVFMGGDPAPWVWEVVSGLIDPGETPETAAHRETLEEAGLTLSRLEPVASAYSSTGANSEFVNMFVAIADFGTRGAGGGLDAEGEDIRVRILSFASLMDGVDNRRFRDTPLITSALWLALHRDRLRKAS